MESNAQRGQTFGIEATGKLLEHVESDVRREVSLAVSVAAEKQNLRKHHDLANIRVLIDALLRCLGAPTAKSTGVHSS